MSCLGAMVASRCNSCGNTNRSIGFVPGIFCLEKVSLYFLKCLDLLAARILESSLLFTKYIACTRLEFYEVFVVDLHR